MTKQPVETAFDALGFSPAEASHLKIRADLMIAIKKYIEKNKLTQKKAAKQLGVDQPRINKLLNGHIELFTIDKLVKMLEKVDIRVDIHVSLKKLVA